MKTHPLSNPRHIRLTGLRAIQYVDALGGSVALEPDGSFLADCAHPDHETIMGHLSGRTETPAPAAPVMRQWLPLHRGGEYANNMDEIENAHGQTVAIVWTRQSHDKKQVLPRPCYKELPEGEALMRLFLAAPDLLAALERMLAAHDADVAAGSLIAAGNGVAAEQARAAIAKATGGAL